MSCILHLRGAIKSYEWGKLGLDSRVAQLCSASSSVSEVKNDVPYAELWMGTHPSGPSYVTSKDCTLLEYIEKNPNYLGSETISHFGSSGLPFLFKVLSVRQPLSIQAHPDKKTAEILHQQHPDLYPDDNHKPEMAIALTDFELLYGFRPMAEIKSFVTELQPLQQVIGSDVLPQITMASISNDSKVLKAVFTSVMSRSKEEYEKPLADLLTYFQQEVPLSAACHSIKDVFLRIHNHYPVDIGCFAIFFMNYIILKPGSSIYVDANEPHSYLLGDCIECMACSDNVVRAGLTPKFKDVKTLCDILTFRSSLVEQTILAHTVHDKDPFVTIYKPPIKEFAVDRIEIPEKTTHYELFAVNGASTFLVVEGDGTAKAVDSDEFGELILHKGSILFVSSNTKLEINCESKLLMFRAYCNL